MALEARVKEIGTEVQALQEQLRQAEEEGQKLADSADGMTKRYFTLRNEQESLRTELSAKSADMTATQESIDRSESRMAEVRSDCAAAQDRQADAEQQLKQARKALTRAREEATACQNTLEGYRLREQTRREKRDALQKQTTELSVSLETLRSRLKLFEEMQGT